MPLQSQASSDDLFSRRDRGAVGGGSGGRGRGGYPAAGGAPPGGSASVLDLLLSTALEELPSRQFGPGVSPLPMLPRAAAPSTAPPPVPPGKPPAAPRRVRALPPPPVVPEELLSGLRPAGGSSAFTARTSSCASTAGSGTLDGDTAASGGASVPAALQQALAWLAASDGSACHRAGARDMV